MQIKTFLKVSILRWCAGIGTERIQEVGEGA